MSRCVLKTTRDTLPEVGAFIRERIPHAHRSCWSIYKRRVTAESVRPPHLSWAYEYDFWFARRYDTVGFELKMRFG